MANKQFITCHTGYAGMDAHYLIVFDDDATEQEITQTAWELGLENAAMYGIEPFPDDFEDGQDDEPYSDNIEGYAVPYEPKKHNGHLYGHEEGYEALPDE